MTRPPRRSVILSCLLPSILLGAAMAAEPSTSAPTHTNRLKGETSPYLLQHAHNPVDWRPWGPEAFEEARRRQVPLLVSIGYSTCYWCHVMERECFENEAIARQMNEGYVCVKVDREERPDVDDIYMTALQIIQRGAGGWPLNIFITPPQAAGPEDPGLKPFYAVTYLPPEPRGGSTSFPQLMTNITEYWTTKRDDVLGQAEQLANAVRESRTGSGETERIDEAQISAVFATLTNLFDRRYAGFGAAPKFPQPVYLDYLLDTIHILDDPAVQDLSKRMIRQTLDAMAMGGIRDHVGGGFHRYATDEQWLVPHFEKMLYDNAQLASLYAKAYALGADEFDAHVARHTLNYVLREMTDPSGAFYSAQDAEVNGREGQNYLWTHEQLVEVLGDDAAFASKLYAVDPDGQGNFRDPHHPEDGWTNILHLQARPEVIATEMGFSLEELREKQTDVDQRLYAARLERDQPGLDDKVITSWNGLMIAALAEAAVALGETRFLDAAEKSADAILEHMRESDGSLLRTARKGVVKTPALLEDHAYLVHGLIELHEASAASGRAELKYIDAARDLTNRALDLFADETGNLYDTRADQPDLFFRARSFYDGATPSATSVMLHNLIDLFELTGEARYRERAIDILASISSEIRRSPAGTINSVKALFRLLTIDSSIADRFGPAEESLLADAPIMPVKVLASTDRVRVPEEGAVEVSVLIEIEDGYHINAAEPGVPGMTGLRFWISGSESVHIEAAYPPGEAYTGGALPEGSGPLMVHTGAVEVILRLSRTDQPWAGRPIISLAYQACTHTRCDEPKMMQLDIALDP